MLEKLFKRNYLHTSQTLGAPFLTLQSEQTRFQRQFDIPLMLIGSSKLKFKNLT